MLDPCLRLPRGHHVVFDFDFALVHMLVNNVLPLHRSPVSRGFNISRSLHTHPPAWIDILDILILRSEEPGEHKHRIRQVISGVERALLVEIENSTETRRQQHCS